VATRKRCARRRSPPRGDRQRAIVDGPNRAEAGALAGRTDETPALSVDVVDGTRVLVKDRAGQTMAGTCAEEADGRVVVTPQGRAGVFTRQGRRLVNGPMRLDRMR
jgi:hypothetical protein